MLHALPLLVIVPLVFAGEHSAYFDEATAWARALAKSDSPEVAAAAGRIADALGEFRRLDETGKLPRRYFESIEAHAAPLRALTRDVKVPVDLASIRDLADDLTAKRDFLLGRPHSPNTAAAAALARYVLASRPPMAPGSAVNSPAEAASAREPTYTISTSQVPSLTWNGSGFTANPSLVPYAQAPARQYPLPSSQTPHLSPPPAGHGLHIYSIPGIDGTFHHVMYTTTGWEGWGGATAGTGTSAAPADTTQGAESDFVRVTVNTLGDDRQKKDGYDVFFVYPGLVSAPDRHRTFDSQSSPTTQPIEPGTYLFWAAKGGLAGEKKKLMIGGDGQGSRMIDLRIPPEPKTP